MGHVEDFVRDGIGLNEPFFARPFPFGRRRMPRRWRAAIFAEPGRLDGPIDGDISDVNTLGAQIARQGLGEDSLRGLGRRK